MRNPQFTPVRNTRIPYRVIDKWAETWPFMLVRNDSLNWSCNLIKPDTLRISEAKTGRPKSFLIGSKCAYERDEIVRWMKEKYGVPDTEGDGAEVPGNTGQEAGPGEGSRGA